MADEKKVKKTKKKAEAEAAPPPAEAAPPPPAPEPEPPKRASTRNSKKAKRTGSNPLSIFSERQVNEFKEAFNLMDNDKDGVIGKNDLRATYDALGRMANEKELDEMLNEASGPLNFNTLLMLFANRMSGNVDDEDVVINAFKSFDENGKIPSEKLKHALMTWGEKFSANEVEDAFEQMVIDNQGRIDTGKLIALLTAAAEEEEEEE
jgi:Ca2+-binding EF-hand superfamily protein